MPTLINRPGKAKAVDTWPLGEYRFMPQWDFVNSYLKSIGMNIDGKVYITTGGGRWVDTSVYPAVYDDRVFPTPSLTNTIIDKADVYSVLIKGIGVVSYQGVDVLFGTGNPNSTDERGLYRSTDLGKNWTRVYIPPGSVGVPEKNNLPFLFNGKLWLAVPARVLSSLDGGVTWSVEAIYDYNPVKIGTVEGNTHFLTLPEQTLSASWPGTQLEQPYVAGGVCYIAHRRTADNNVLGGVSYTEDGITWVHLAIPAGGGGAPYFKIINNTLIMVLPQSTNRYVKIYYIDDGGKAWKGGSETIDLGSSNDLIVSTSNDNRSTCNVLFYEDGCWYIPKLFTGTLPKDGSDVYSKLSDGSVLVSNMYRSTNLSPTGFVLNSVRCVNGSYGVNGSTDTYTFGPISYLPMPRGHVDDGFMINGQFISGKCLAEIYETASWPTRSTPAKAFQAMSLYLSLSVASHLKAGEIQVTLDEDSYLRHRKSPFHISKLIGANINSSILPTYQSTSSYWVRIK